MRHGLREGAALLATGVLVAGCGAPKTAEYDATNPSTWTREQLISRVVKVAEATCADPTLATLQDTDVAAQWPAVAKATNAQHMLAHTPLIDLFRNPYNLANGEIAHSLEGLVGQLVCTSTITVQSDAP